METLGTGYEDEDWSRNLGPSFACDLTGDRERAQFLLAASDQLRAIRADLDRRLRYVRGPARVALKGLVIAALYDQILHNQYRKIESIGDWPLGSLVDSRLALLEPSGYPFTLVGVDSVAV